MPVVRLGDLAQAMIENLVPKFGYKPEDIQIDIIGIRDGEKMYEHLMTEEESQRAYEIDDMFIVMPNTKINKYAHKKFRKTKQDCYTSKNADILNKRDVQKLLSINDRFHKS